MATAVTATAPDVTGRAGPRSRPTPVRPLEESRLACGEAPCAGAQLSGRESWRGPGPALPTQCHRLSLPGRARACLICRGIPRSSAECLAPLNQQQSGLRTGMRARLTVRGNYYSCRKQASLWNQVPVGFAGPPDGVPPGRASPSARGRRASPARSFAHPDIWRPLARSLCAGETAAEAAAEHRAFFLSSASR
ncbi:hypothetical protein SKAU_G00199960 [Synaphobranchus kaupii]|uniref:Uncharacterized protein n=1 Tax=Synaphobranchus kaupii TaxID=118154 RepID=A0A9Q1IW00_SYNKA|nr:hypothetical protein SKAU_G00199960 [Synaphobranchus kaupii]